ncbi:hypothetical protein E0494_05265 [Marinilabiliaceae bacterium JC040]|nr:hypothetical protein [Marinilabiliaceae bacterium JC040]
MNTKYWMYAPGEKAKMWDEFYDKGIMGLGWIFLGNLKKYKSKEEIANKLQEYYDTTKSKMNSVDANYDFANRMSIGDVIIAKRGRSEYLGYGIVSSDYYYEDKLEEYKSFRKVNWIKKGLWIEENANIIIKTLTEITNKRLYIDKLNELMGIKNSLDIKTSKEMNSDSLNSILYGPPGTGKTYNTINKALELCGEDIKGKSRTEIKELFDLIVDEGRIVFTTFHQSMTYEDFVEGIKPVEPEKEGDPLIFKVEKGIFRILCVSAAFSLAQERESETTELLLDFSLAYDQFVEYINEKLPSKENIELTTKNGGNILVDDISSQGNIIIKHPGKSKTYSVSKERLSRINAAFPDLSKVNNISQEFRSIIGGCNSTAIWSVLNAIRTKIFSYKNYNRTTHKYTFEEKEQVVQSLKKEDYNGKKGKAHVIIIDEINRGNVSQIFGELITLLEEDKRLGNSEALQVQLPYSKDWFGVPPNVYIIGTMNTADRSVEALDSALRRRFSFTEISPDTDLLKGEISNSFDFSLSTILETLNRRIEKLLDKDHMIGHSYFLKVNNIKDLKAVFQNNIIPLLQEYFFGDYGKIGLIIGANFFDIIDNQTEESFFAHFDDYDTSPFIEKKIYHLKNVLKMPDEEFINAIHIFLGQKS